MQGIAGWDIRELELALARQNPDALRDCYKHFRPLLMQHARLLGVERSLRDETVMTFIGDMLLELPTRPSFPANLTGYVLTAFRYRVGALYRRGRLEKPANADAPPLDQSDGGVEAESCSAYSRRAAAGESAQDDGLSPDTRRALREFWRCVRERLSADDRILLGLLRNDTAGRDIADVLQIPPGAVRVRIHRLRVRVRTAAAATLEMLAPADRRRVAAILRRSGLLVTTPGSAAPSPAGRPAHSDWTRAVTGHEPSGSMEADHNE